MSRPSCHEEYRSSKIVGAWMWALLMLYAFGHSLYRFVDDPVFVWRGIWVAITALILAIDARRLIVTRRQLANETCPCRAHEDE